MNAADAQVVDEIGARMFARKFPGIELILLRLFPGRRDVTQVAFIGLEHELIERRLVDPGMIAPKPRRLMHGPQCFWWTQRIRGGKVRVHREISDEDADRNVLGVFAPRQWPLCETAADARALAERELRDRVAAALEYLALSLGKTARGYEIDIDQREQLEAMHRAAIAIAHGLNIKPIGASRPALRVIDGGVEMRPSEQRSPPRALKGATP